MEGRAFRQRLTKFSTLAKFSDGWPLGCIGLPTTIRSTSSFCTYWLRKSNKSFGLHRRQSIGNDLQGVGHSQPRAFLAIINGENSRHEYQLMSFIASRQSLRFLLLEKQPSVALGVILAATDGVAALHSAGLIGIGRGNNAIHIDA